MIKKTWLYCFLTIPINIIYLDNLTFMTVCVFCEYVISYMVMPTMTYVYIYIYIYMYVFYHILDQKEKPLHKCDIAVHGSGMFTRYSL